MVPPFLQNNTDCHSLLACIPLGIPNPYIQPHIIIATSILRGKLRIKIICRWFSSMHTCQCGRERNQESSVAVIYLVFTNFIENSGETGAKSITVQLQKSSHYSHMRDVCYEYFQETSDFRELPTLRQSSILFHTVFLMKNLRMENDNQATCVAFGRLHNSSNLWQCWISGASTV